MFDIFLCKLAWSLVRAAWAAVADSNKRRVASVSAFLSAIIHPNIFGNVSMHSINGDHGPLKWVSYSACHVQCGCL